MGGGALDDSAPMSTDRVRVGFDWARAKPRPAAAVPRTTHEQRPAPGGRNVHGGLIEAAAPGRSSL